MPPKADGRIFVRVEMNVNHLCWDEKKCFFFKPCDQLLTLMMCLSESMFSLVVLVLHTFDCTHWGQSLMVLPVFGRNRPEGKILETVGVFETVKQHGKYETGQVR